MKTLILSQSNLKIDAMPIIEAENQTLYISFPEPTGIGSKYTSVIADEFSAYWGIVQNEIHNPKFNNIQLNLQYVGYMNLFCASKIILCLLLSEKEVSINWPLSFRDNKMMRYFYNLGILDLLFSTGANKIVDLDTRETLLADNVNNYVNGRAVLHYNEICDFSECFDRAIKSYQVFRFKKIKNLKYDSKISETIKNDIFPDFEHYFETNQKLSQYTHSKERTSLYLFELLQNITEHAYDHGQTGIFAVAMTNDYLPGYVYKKNHNDGPRQKFKNRERRLEREIPLKVFGGIEERYLGSMTIFVDDVGIGISQRVRSQPGNEDSNLGHYQQLYRDIYMNGLKVRRRSKNKTALNGLKLIADQVSYNNDNLWLHDSCFWLNCTFTELGKILEPDRGYRSNTEHISGVTYELRVNFARSSKEKIRAYTEYGVCPTLAYQDISNICTSEFANSRLTVIDRYNLANRTIHMGDVLQEDFDILLIRLRSTQKKQLSGDIKRIFNQIPIVAAVKEVVFFDLNQIALFQMKAVIETPNMSKIFLDFDIENIVMISLEGYVFVMRSDKDTGTYSMHIDYAKEYIAEQKKALLGYLSFIFYLDRQIVTGLLRARKHSDIFISNSVIAWDSHLIHSYLNIEKALDKQEFFDLFLRTLMRCSGLMGPTVQFQFLEKFLRDAFEPYLNEFTENPNNTLYIGSVIMSKKTEKHRVNRDDWKLYFFQHPESESEFDHRYIFLFDYPAKTNPNVSGSYLSAKYRRILYTNRIERTAKQNDNFIYYTSPEYRSLLGNLQYNVGFSAKGIIDIVVNDHFKNAFFCFAMDQLRILLDKHDKLFVTYSGSICTKQEWVNTITKLKEQLDEEFTDNKSKSLGNIKEVIYLKPHEGDVGLTVCVADYFSLEHYLQSMHDYGVVYYITMFHSMPLDKGFDSYVVNGYIPFIPINQYQTDPPITSKSLDGFAEFTETLTPYYRNVLNKYLREHGNIQTNYTQQVMFQSSSLLEDCVTYFIDTSVNRIHTWTEMHQDEAYRLFVDLITYAHTSLIQLKSRPERYFDQAVVSINEDTVISYLVLVLMYCLRLLPRKSLSQINETKMGKQIEITNSNFLKILIAKTLYNTDKVLYQEIVAQFFFASDISFYHSILYHMLFNEHGDDHSSPIGRLIKSDIKDSYSEEDIRRNVAECVSLLKLTRPYEDNYEDLNLLQAEIGRMLQNDAPAHELNREIMKLQELAKTRYMELSHHETNAFVKFINEVMEYANDSEKEVFLSNLQDKVIYRQTLNQEVLKYKSIYTFKNTLVFEELACLFLDAHKHNKNMRLKKINGTGQAETVWIFCDIDDFIHITIYNYIDRPFSEIEQDIQQKKRIGKTHLGKFNIQVIYDQSNDFTDVNCVRVNALETKITIQYFR